MIAVLYTTHILQYDQVLPFHANTACMICLINNLTYAITTLCFVLCADQSYTVDS
jgi:hypothetical protein